MPNTDVASIAPAECGTVESVAALSDLATTEDFVAMAWEHALRRKLVDRDMDWRNLDISTNQAMSIIRYIRSLILIELLVNFFFEAPIIRQMTVTIYDGSALVAAAT
jgi:hypothetical protein